MEPSKEAISIRMARIWNLFAGPANNKAISTNKHTLTRDGLLDALIVLYNEYNQDNVKKVENISLFIEKFRGIMVELRSQRVNLSDFHVQTIIGRGHFGEVQIVKERHTGDVYAMKTLKKNSILKNPSAAFYEEERDIMANTTSPWLTSLQYAFQDLSNLYLVMEYHPGGDLLTLLDHYGNKLSEDMATFYLAELVLAIKSLHSMGYVHRDIKPGNILLDRCGHIKLADFGTAAKLTAAGCVLSMMAVGTPEYIAPEILQVMENNDKGNRRGSYGVECDYWSLGIVAFEIVIGRTPFNGSKLPDIYQSIMNHSTALKLPVNEAYSSAFLDLLAKLLTQSSLRIGAEKLSYHAFFKSIVWNNLRNTVPPHVPVVKSEDDPSNFPKLSRLPQAPCPEDYQTRTALSGRDLPFIGFTFTHGSVLPSQRSKDLDSSFAEAPRAKSKKEMDELLMKLALAEQRGNDKNNKSESLAAELESKLRLLHDTETASKKLEQDYQRSQKEITSLKRHIESSKEERRIQEEKAISLIRDMKAKLTRKYHEEEARLSGEMELLKSQLTERDDLYHQLLDKVQKQETDLIAAKKENAELEAVAKANDNKLTKVRLSVRQSICGTDRQLEQMTRAYKEKIEALEQRLVEEQNAHTETDALRQADKVTADEIEAELTRMEAEVKKVKEDNHRLTERNAKLTKEVSDVRAAWRQDLSKKQDTGRNQIVELQQKLSKERGQCAELKNKLSSMEAELNESIVVRENQEIAVSARHAEREQQIGTLNELLKQASEEKQLIKVQLKEAQEKEANESIRSSSLETHLEEIRQSLRRLEEENTRLKVQSDSESRQAQSAEINIETQVLEAQIKKLDEQLEKLREQSILDRNTKAECELKLWKIEKELSDAKIDLRMAGRETKEVREEVKLLVDEKKSRQLKAIAYKTAYAQQVSELNDKISEHIQQASDLQKKLTAAENDISIFRLVSDEAKAKLAEKSEELGEVKLKMKTLEVELQRERGNVLILEARINSLMDDLKKANKRCENASEKEKTLANDCVALKEKYDYIFFNYDQLQKTCSDLDDELQEYSKKIESLNAKIKTSSNEKKDADAEIARLQNELLLARQALNEEKSLKLKTEMRVKMLEGDVASGAEDASALETQAREYKKMAEHLTVEVSNLGDACADAENLLESEKRRNATLFLEVNALKEETSKYLTRMQLLKDSNHGLTSKLGQCEEECEVLRDNLEKARDAIQELEAYHEQRDFKTKAQLKQQTKLIEYLQQKAESQKKKKTLTEKLFGSSKENFVPNGPLGAKDFENLLTQERTKNIALNDKLMKAQAELAVLKNDRIVDAVNSRTANAVINTPRTKEAVVALSQSNERTDFERKTSTLRMRHNIPHRFEQRLCMRATKCAACLDSVHFGRSAATCLECGIQAHSKCSLLLPHACGLPLAFARHYSRALKESGEEGTPERDGERPVQMEGYVKLPTRGNSCWERRYLMLEGTELKAYEHEPTAGMMPIETLQICPENGVASISSAVPYSGVINTAESDLPYLIKVTVTPLTTCWPGSSMLIMTLGFPDKQAWASALEEVIQHSKASLSGRPRNQGTAIFSADQGSLDVNCVVQLSSDLLLIGAAEGLFSIRTSAKGATPVKIAGVHDVHQIALVPAVGVALMIAGTSRDLVQCELGQLTSSAEARNASIVTTPVLMPTTAKSASCHLFAVATTTDSNQHARTTLCAATADKLVLLTWSVNNVAFNVVKTLETAEPCSCIHFASHSIILGCDKFFEIDLRDFSAEEFLDPSDKSLSHVCYGVRQLNSFPIAIIDVSTSRANAEYLLAFNEFGVFVDKFGQRSRIEDIKWSHMPFAFSYRKPYLFIFHFTSVEVMKLTPDSFTRDLDDSVATVNYPGQTFIEMNSPKMLGVSTGSDTVFVSHLTDRSVLQLVAMNGAQVFKDDTGYSCSSLDTVQTKDTADLHTDFSFTSSLVQSLDGSDTEDGKHVRFGQNIIMHTEL